MKSRQVPRSRRESIPWYRLEWAVPVLLGLTAGVSGVMRIGDAVDTGKIAGAASLTGRPVAQVSRQSETTACPVELCGDSHPTA